MSDIAKQIAALRKCLSRIKTAQLANQATIIPEFLDARAELRKLLYRLPHATERKLPIIRAVAAYAVATEASAVPRDTTRGTWKQEVESLHIQALGELEALAVRRRHRKPPKDPLPLTQQQLEAYELVSKHNGNRAAAAREVGKSAVRMGQLYTIALAKLAQAGIKKTKTHALPRDSRGQRDAPDPTGPRVPKGRVNRKPLERHEQEDD
jgi:hypothetical protein